MAAIKRKAWRDVASLTPRQRALCEVAETLSATPTRMTSESWQPLRDLGFGDDAILEVIHVVGLFNYFTRLADGAGLRLDPQIAEAGEREQAMVHPQRA